jgi:hypothetical protein
MIPSIGIKGDNNMRRVRLTYEVDANTTCGIASLGMTLGSMASHRPAFELRRNMTMRTHG